MKKLFFSLLLMSALLYVSAQERVLFVGNSLTYYNDMPTLFETIASVKGYPVTVESYTVGGTGLAEMLATGEVVRLIQSEQWDKMVLQPGTGESAGGSIPTDSSAWVVRQLVETLHAINPNAKVCLYEISNGITPGDGDGDYDYYLYTQQRILDSVTRIARLSGLPFAPAGECFREHYATHHDLMLHSVFNDIHPNLAGSYLVACAIFETLYEVPVAPCDYYSTIDPEQAEYLQQIADTVVLPNRERWLMGPGESPDPDPDPNTNAITQSNIQAFNIYPNPTTGQIHLDAINVSSIKEVVIHNLRGNKRVLTPQDGTLDLSTFAPGIYILQIGSHRQKVVVCHP